MKMMRTIWAGTLGIYCILGIILPNYMGIIRCHDKDPYRSISIMECHKGFERCSIEMQCLKSAPASNHQNKRTGTHRHTMFVCLFVCLPDFCVEKIEPCRTSWREMHRSLGQKQIFLWNLIRIPPKKKCRGSFFCKGEKGGNLTVTTSLYIRSKLHEV